MSLRRAVGLAIVVVLSACGLTLGLGFALALVLHAAGAPREVLLLVVCGLGVLIGWPAGALASLPLLAWHDGRCESTRATPGW